MEKLASAEFDRNVATVHNIRLCEYRTQDDFTVHYYDKTYDLRKLESVDFIVCPFSADSLLAHTFLSFGFEDGNYLAVSVEIRKTREEKFNPLLGFFNHYEIIYVVADERDVIQLRTNYRLDDVYIYRANATPAQAQALFRDVMARVNKLKDEPEFYNTITNNCTTNVLHHVNDIAPDKIRYNWEVLLPAYSDRLAFNRGLIKTDLSFEETRQKARVNELAYIYRDSPDFSVQIRK